MTPDEASASLQTLDGILKSINDHVNSVLGNILINVVPFARDIIQWVHDRVADVSHAIEAIIGNITSTVSGAISAVAPHVIDFLLGVTNNVFNDVHAILGNLATAEEFTAGFIGEVMRHAQPLGGFLLGAVGGGISGGFTELLKFLERQDAQTIDHFLDSVLEAKSMPPWLHTMTSGLRSRGAEWQALALPILVGVLLQPIGEAMVNPMLIELRQQANFDFQTAVASPESLIEQRLKNVISDDLFYAGMAYNNFNNAKATQMLLSRQQRMLPEEVTRLVWRQIWSQQDAERELDEVGIAPGRTDAKIEAARPILSEDEIRQSFLRGTISEASHDTLMSMHGYKADAIARKKALYYLIPSPQDLIHMGIRNVFDPQIVEEFNLAQDAPPDFFKAAAQQGISQDWAAKFWEAHWIVPGEDQAFRMYQRTLDQPIDKFADEITLLDGTKVYNIIGKHTLNLFLKDKDVPPYYREKLAAIAYHPLNRIDIRRMRITGSLTKAQVQRAYLDLGYDLVNATRLTEFVEALATQTRKDKAQPFIDNLRRRILDFYVSEKLELSDASFALTDLGFTKEEADHYLAEAALVQKAEDALQVENGIGRIFVSGYITEDDARKRLGAAGAPGKAVDRLIRKWNLQRELHGDTEHFHKARDLTKSEITEAYSDRLMSRVDASTFLKSLGYPQNEADIVLALADYKAARDSRAAMTEAVKALYVNGIRDLVTTSNALDSLGLPTDRRDGLLSQWTLLRETRTEKLPLATLRDLARAGKLNRSAAFSHLKRHRYTDDDANLMLDLWYGN